MLGKKTYVFSSTDLEIIREYLKISIIEKDEEEPHISILGESSNFDNYICVQWRKRKSYSYNRNRSRLHGLFALFSNGGIGILCIDLRCYDHGRFNRIFDQKGNRNYLRF